MRCQGASRRPPTVGARRPSPFRKPALEPPGAVRVRDAPPRPVPTASGTLPGPLRRVDRALPRLFRAPPGALRRLLEPSGHPVQNRRCSNRACSGALLHRCVNFFPSTTWGPGSCPYCVHRLGSKYSIRPGHVVGDLWSTLIHSLWTEPSPTGVSPSCPPAAHRPADVVPSFTGLLHTCVHCSATQHPLSPPGVKGVTPSCLIGLWGTWVKLGTGLGRSGPLLCIRCAQLPPVHRSTRLSTAAAHRTGGQKTGADLRKHRYPRFPQGLLLLPLRVSQESASKWGLCTTREAAASPRSARLDPEQQRLSVLCVRLVPGAHPAVGRRLRSRRRRPAGRASNSRRRFR
ncbi:hypothetical protein YUWDRAFT_04626 [Streptomyces sp. AmelKG-D3]|nr:hypothetical protein YUWDRAFT_04626 [Streptomyces sp. AmelKG-D3]